jgi:hypothetical protein
LRAGVLRRFGRDRRFGHLQKDGGQKDGGFSVRLRTGPLESA